MATHSSILAWRIPQTEGPDGLQPMGSQSQTRLSALSSAHSRKLAGPRSGTVPAFWRSGSRRRALSPHDGHAISRCDLVTSGDRAWAPKTHSWVQNSALTLPTWAPQVALVVKNLPANAGDIRDAGSVPGPGRSPGGGNDNPLQYSCLENPMDRGAWQATVHKVTQNQIQLKRLSTFYLCDSGHLLNLSAF